MSHTNRIVLLIDMDCFYCQVEENLEPSLSGKPIAVVQYNEWRGGGIIAVNYPARDQGVTRHMRGDDAKAKCPDIILVKVPQVRGKADLSKYRDAGKRVAAVLQTFTPCLERASVDEAYLDITDIVEKRIRDNNADVTVEQLKNSFVVGNTLTDFIENVTKHKLYDESNFKLAVGGVIAEEIRAAVSKSTGYKCSAGVAHNKILAKLVCGLHKPNKQTLLPQEAVPQLYEKLPVRKIQGLGGKFGTLVAEKLNIEHMGELINFTLKELTRQFDEKSASWLYNLARGINTEPVTTRLISKSIGCCKKFPGRTALCTKQDIEHWLRELSEEIFERLEADFEENNRRARQMVVSFGHETATEEVSGSKTHPLNSYEKKLIFENAYKIVQKNCLKDDGSYRVVFLGISVSNFQDVKNVKQITSFFRDMAKVAKKDKSLVAPFKSDLESSSKDVNPSSCHSTAGIIEDTSDDSIYSRKTQEDSRTEDELIYYEQIHPDSIRDQKMFNDSDASNDSISNEVNLNKKEVPSSFFKEYFSNREFNTSKTLDDDLEKENLVDECIELQSTQFRSPEKTMEVESNTCPHCGKVFQDSTEFQSHLDYHFAINMVKSEAHLYRNNFNPPQSSKKGKTVSSACSKSKPIVDYFKLDSGKEDTPKELCGDCNKLIVSSEWQVHMDYHAAKKLRLEMNNPHRQGGKVKCPSKNKKAKAQGNILGFLKST